MINIFNKHKRNKMNSKKKYIHKKNQFNNYQKDVIDLRKKN